MDATQVVIHFIGIVLFTTQVSNDPGLHAILPEIRHDFNPASSASLQTSLSTASGSIPNSSAAPSTSVPATHIEPHVALLIFRRDIVMNASQWQTSTFPPTAGLSQYGYVQLTGEHIAFIANAPNTIPAELPPNMPRLSCATPAALTNGYQRPYSQAAAVVYIPEGTLSPCQARRTASGRIDTRLTLNTPGTLTIVAVKSGGMKTLVLNTSNNPTIYLANVPPLRLSGTRTAPSGQPHYLAYYSMIDRNQPGRCLAQPPSAANVSDCDEKLVFRTVGPATTTISTLFARVRRRFRAIFIPPGGPGTPTEHFPEDRIMLMANAECSNTQWP
jgi:hypothetical protein